MRQLGMTHNDADFFMRIAETRPPQTIANMAIILLNQTDYLLHRLLKRLSEKFMQEGGFSERMMRLRKDRRDF